MLSKRIFGIAAIILNRPQIFIGTFTQSMIFPFSISKYEPRQQTLLLKKQKSIDVLSFLKQNSQRAILQYPYVDIPRQIISYYGKINWQKQRLKDLIAFRILSNLDQNNIKKASEILLPDIPDFTRVEAFKINAGREIFSSYFQKKIQSLKNQFVNSQKLFSQKLIYLIILNNLKKCNQTIELVRQINEDIIKSNDTTGIGSAYYCLLLIKAKLPHNQICNHLLEKLMRNQLKLQEKLRIGMILITLPRFTNFYPPQLVQKIISIFSEGIGLLNNFKLLQIVRRIYEHTSIESIKFSEKLLSHIQQINPSKDKNSIQQLIPLTLKALKYATVLKIDIQPIILRLLQKKQEYFAVFQIHSQKYYKTLLFLWLKQYNKDIQPVVQAHILESLKYYSTQIIADQEQIVKLLTLISKIWLLYTPEQKQLIKKELLLGLLSKYNDDVEIIYQANYIILQDQFDNFFEEKQIIKALKDSLNYFFKETNSQNKLGVNLIKSHANQNIILTTLIHKNKFTIINKLPQIESYNFTQQNPISLLALQHLVVYLYRVIDPSNYSVILQKLQPIILYYLKNKRVGLVTMIDIMKVYHLGNYQKPMIYKKIEKAIYEMLQKFPKLTIKHSNLEIINECICKKSFGCLRFQKMIEKAIQSPNEWEQIKNQYLAGEKEYWKRYHSEKKK